MRTLQKLLLGILVLSLLSITACQEQPKKETPKDEPEQEPEMTKAPRGIISLNEAKTLCNNYENRRGNVIIEYESAQNNSDEKFIPTQFIEFDIKTMKKYIKYVERKARKAKVKPDSLRIYLGNYGPDGKDKNRNTVFVLPTTTIDGKHGGFYIDAEGKAKLIREYWPDENGNQKGAQKSEASFMPSFNTVLYQDESLILNRGHGGPPPTGDF